ncbi:MAG: GSCFA domain-containing protein [Myxococcales bacterium]|nr:GSCFA domain-containing protein [Myxococcales bacterium]
MTEPIVLLAGNCQVFSIARCLKALVPEVRFECFRFAEDPESLARFHASAQGAEALLVQRRLVPHLTDDECTRGIMVPVLAFPAFHPDIVPGALEFVCHTGRCHSALVLGGYKAGLDQEAVLGLFRERVFRDAGYFNVVGSAVEALVAEGKNTDFPMEELLDRWWSLGCFMHTFNHPKIAVFNDVARVLAERLGIALGPQDPDTVPDDELSHGEGWPVYPAIARRFDLPGSEVFKAPRHLDPNETKLGLRDFVYACFDAYARYDRDVMRVHRVDSPRFKALIERYRVRVHQRPAGESNPYRGLPDRAFWRRSVAQVPPREVDPVADLPFTFTRRDRVATAGSCFAQHVSRALGQAGFNYLISERAPQEMSQDQAAERGYGLFSARYGNIYTARQLRQLLYRAYDLGEPLEAALQRDDGRFVDPFRPYVEPAGFATAQGVDEARQEHLACVREMVSEMNVFVFTLGLTEAFVSKAEGLVYPVAPGVVSSRVDPDDYAFVNFSQSEVRDDLVAALQLIRQVNPACKIVLTVSPVPLIATYEEDVHVLTATTYSKAVLRVVADEVSRTLPDVLYFPSYEIITGAFNRGAYFAEDLRSVRPEGVDHVMRLFIRHLTNQAPEASSTPGAPVEVGLASDHIEELFEVQCDEEEVERSLAS